MEILKEESLVIEDLMTSRLGKGYAWLVYRSDLRLLKEADLKFFRTVKEAEQFRLENKEIATERILLATIAGHITRALKETAKQARSDVLLPGKLELDPETLKVLSASKADMRRRAEQVNDELTAWGIAHDLTFVFEKVLATGNVPFILDLAYGYGRDKFDSTVFMQPDKNGIYRIEAFTSTLKKYIEVPSVNINGIDCGKLDKAMHDCYAALRDGFVSLLKMEDAQKNKMQDATVAFANALDKLEQSAEGKAVADLLRAKHWLGTPLEGLITDAKELEHKYIIHQNFDRIGETLFTIREAYNIMSERYVSKDVREGNSITQPWFYRYNGQGPSFSNIVRVTNSENLDLNKNIVRLSEMNIQLVGDASENITKLRQGDEVKGQEISGGYRQDYRIYFNPFLNELETIKSGSRQKIDQSPDKDLRKGRSL